VVSLVGFGPRVLLWINGSFGAGKTQTAHEIRRRRYLRSKEVGYGLHRMTPPALRADFQDHPAWRQGVYPIGRRSCGDSRSEISATPRSS
jgi:hypothetical protein